jgi:hypothetical protein
MKFRHLLPALVAVAVGSAVALSGTQRTVSAYTNRPQFTLASLYRTGAIAGSVATGAVLVAGLAIGRKPNPKADVIRYLEAQTGRADLSIDQRAALAYVAQDLRDSASD